MTKKTDAVKQETAVVKKNWSLTQDMGNKYGVDPEELYMCLRDTMFQVADGVVPTKAQMMMLLSVAHEYNLNPFTREIYAFPDKKSGIIPIVGVDGWSRIINEHTSLDGIGFRDSENVVMIDDDAKPCPEWIECAIYRKDRTHPVLIREYLDEVYRPAYSRQGKNGPYKVTGAWQSHTKRMLRHKALIQCARIAFGFTGIYDRDEAERIVEAEVVSSSPSMPEMPRKKEAETLPDPPEMTPVYAENTVQESVKQDDAPSPMAPAQKNALKALFEKVAKLSSTEHLGEYLEQLGTSYEGCASLNNDQAAATIMALNAEVKRLTALKRSQGSEEF